MKTCKWCLRNGVSVGNECLTCLGAQADLEPGEWDEYVAYMREETTTGCWPNPDSNPFSLTMKGWGVWSIIPTLEIELKLRELAPLILGGDNWPERAEERRLT